MILLIALSILFLQVAAYAQDSLSIQPVAEFRGQKVLFVTADRIVVEDIEVDYNGGRLESYDREIVLWDITNPAEPEELDRCLAMYTYLDPWGYDQGFCSDAVLKDTLLFAMVTRFSHFEGNMTYGPSDLIVYDIANIDTLWQRDFESYYTRWSPGPDDPVVIPVGSMALSGDFLYVAQGMDGISIYDVSDPEDVEEVANLNVKSDNLVLYNDLLIFTYLPQEGREGIDIFLAKFDVSDPTNPEELGEVSLNNDYYWWYWDDMELVIWEDYLYLFPYLWVDEDIGFIEIYDIGGDDEPELAERIEADFIGRGVRTAISEGRLYFKDRYSIRVFDLAYPLNPELIYLQPDTTDTRQISTYEDYIYIGPYYRDANPRDDIIRVLHVEEPTAIEADVQNQPDNFKLYPVYPNPFNSETNIRYQLPAPCHVVLTILDIKGRELERLVDGRIEAGYHRTVWDASGLPSGIYFYRLEAGSFANTRKLMLIR